MENKYCHVHDRKMTKPQPNEVAVILVGGTVVLIAAIHWQLTLTLAFICTGVYAARKYHVAMTDPDRIIVNDYATMNNLWHKLNRAVGYR